MQEVQLLFSLGPMEIGMLLVLAIFLFGPKRLPEIGAALGETLNSFRSASKGDPKSLPEAQEEKA